MEFSEQIVNGFCKEGFHLSLNTKPLEFNVDKLIASHDRFNLLLPVWICQRTTTCLLWVIKLGILFFLVVTGGNLIMSYVNKNNISLLQVYADKASMNILFFVYLLWCTHTFFWDIKCVFKFTSRSIDVQGLVNNWKTILHITILILHCGV